jgi:hypothetical protein
MPTTRTSLALNILSLVKPRWNATARELHFGESLVKRFLVPAKNQDLILATFEEDGWPQCIDDPLPYNAGIDPRQRLKAAIRHLNSSHQTELIRFHGNGTGDGVRWECIGV